MGSQPNPMPGLRGLYRNLITQTVKKFKGIDAFHSAAAVSPDVALDCLNVLVSNSGALEKMRVPVALTQVIIGNVGPDRFFDYQQAQGTRHLIMSFGQFLQVLDTNNAFASVVQDINALNIGTWDWVTSNNIAYGTNGQRMLRWNGSAFQAWGLVAPVAAPTIFSTATAAIGGIAGGPLQWTITFFQSNPPMCVRAGDTVTLAGTVANDGTWPVIATTGTLSLNPGDVCSILIQNAGGAFAGAAGTIMLAGIMTLTQGGRKLAFAYRNSGTNDESNMSPPTVASGNLTAAALYLSTTTPPDSQIDQLAWYGTLDGGSDFYFLGNTGITHSILGFNATDWGILFEVNTPDPPTPGSTINTAVKGAFINNPPIQGKFVCKAQGRIFVFNLVGAPQDIIYSGNERIFVGRPESCFPPFNRLRLATGADAIAGGGVIQSGVVAFDRSNRMFMFRGIVEDVTTSAPLLFSAFLEELPWKLGAFSHYSIACTPYGLAWLSSDKSVHLYNGTDKPVCISVGLAPLLKQITSGTESQARGVYLNWLDKEWYVLSVAWGGSVYKNRLFFFDLNPDPDANAGIWISDIQADDVGIIEDPNGQRRLCISQNGIVYRVQIESVTVNGITTLPTSANPDAHMVAFWRGGFYGNENPQTRKMFRYGRMIADAAGFGVKGYIVNDDDIQMPNPEVHDLEWDGSKFTINLKAKRMSTLIQFPSADADCAIAEMHVSYVPTSET
jgi:hypothetical protein